MFGIDFYPTPPELIERLVEPYLFKYKDTVSTRGALASPDRV